MHTRIHDNSLEYSKRADGKSCKQQPVVSHEGKLRKTYARLPKKVSKVKFKLAKLLTLLSDANLIPLTHL